MEKITCIFSVAVFFVLFQGTLGEWCTKKTSNIWSYETTIFCAYDCCGSDWDRYCCSYWSGGVIGGTVIGSIIGLCILIAIIVCIAKACTRSGGHGRIVQPTQYPQSATQPYQSTTQYGMAPPPYPNPGVAYPPQPGQEPFGPGRFG